MTIPTGVLDARLTAKIDTIGVSRTSHREIERFHESTKFKWTTALRQFLRAQTYNISRGALAAASAHAKRYRHFPQEPLAPARHCPEALDDMLAMRRSPRKMRSQAVSRQTLSDVLGNALGRGHADPVTQFPDIVFHLAPYPSAGARYPVETYILLPEPTEDSVAVYHYAAVENMLTRISRVPGKAVELAFCLGEGQLATLGFLAVFTATFQRSTEKYGARGYRFCLLEAGHAAQNLCLRVVPEGLQGLAWGGFVDDRVNDLLRIDGVVETVVHCVLIGAAAES